MTRRVHDDEFDYTDDEYVERIKSPKKFKKDEPILEKKRQWDHENWYDRRNDYDDR
jgi:hypothetical protein